MTTILENRALLDLIENVETARTLREQEHASAYTEIHTDNVLRAVAEYLLDLREQRLNGSRS